MSKKFVFETFQGIKDSVEFKKKPFDLNIQFVAKFIKVLKPKIS